MVDEIAPAERCGVCGAPMNAAEFAGISLCVQCAGVSSSPPFSGDAEASALHVAQVLPQGVALDPDHPPWGPRTGMSVWLASVAAIIVIPIIAVIMWYGIQSARGAHLPTLAARQEVLEWLKSPTLLLVQVLSTILAHGITIAVCWAIVTKMGMRPFWESLGWNWAGRPRWYWPTFSACVIVALLGVTPVLTRFLPQSEDNSFAELLKSSQQVRIAIAVLATFTAPLVEETVYRGLLFSSLRRYLGVGVTVLIVTVMFAGVHVLQYWGAWVSVAGLSLLSLTLTVVRAKTKSILPCVLIHTLNNAFFSVLILLNKAS